MMDYRLFPNEKEAQLEEECKVQLNKVDETIHDMKDRKDEQIKRKPESIAEKLAFRGFAVIAVIIPLVACVSVCFSVYADHDGDWNGIIMGIFGGIVSAVIIVGVLFGIASVIDGISTNKRRKKINQINEKFEYDVVDVKKKKADISNEYRNKILEYKKEFYEESDKRTPKFVGNAVTDEIIQWMAAVIINDINTANRGPQISSVQKVLNFKVTEDEVATSFGNYIFIQHRISNLVDAAETMALAKAIGTGLQTEIMAQFPMDPMGTPARVNASYTDDGHAVLGRITYNSEKVD